MNLLQNIIVISIILSLLLILSIILYNKIQNVILNINEAEKEIDETLRNKFDIITNTIELIKNEKNIDDLLCIKDEKDKNLSSFEFSRLLKEYEIRIVNLKDKIRKLTKNEVFIENINNFKKINIKIDSQIRYFDDNILIYNNLVKKFPTNIISIVFKHKKKQFFDNKNLEDNIEKDFKL